MSVADFAVGAAAELPVVRPPCVGRFDDPAQPEREPVRGARGWFGAAALDVELDEAAGVELVADLRVVVAAVQGECADLGEQSVVGDGVQGGFEHDDVVAVGAVDRPADRDPGTLRRNGPLPAEFGPVNRAFAGALTATGGLVQGAVDRHHVQVELDDPVVAGTCFGLELVEHTGRDPLRRGGRAAWCRTPRSS